MDLQQSVEISDESRVVVRYEVGVESVERRQLPADAAEHQTYTAGTRCRTCTGNNSPSSASRSVETLLPLLNQLHERENRTYTKQGGSVAEWLACWTQAQKGLGSNRSRDAVG